jgi:SET domain-containing protein
MEYKITPIRLKLKESTIKNAGLGVFAEENIPIGTLIGKYEGTRLSIDVELSEEEAKYVYTINNEYIFTACTCIFRYINDIVDLESSVRHNKRIYLLLYYNVDFVEINNEVYIKTIDNIQAGDELFIHYGSPYWLNQISNIRHKKYQVTIYKDKALSDDENSNENIKIRRVNSMFF